MQDSEQEVVLSSSDVSTTAPIPLTEEELKLVGGGSEGIPIGFGFH